VADGDDDEGDRDARPDLDDGLKFLHGMMAELKREIFETQVSVLALVEGVIEDKGIDEAGLKAQMVVARADRQKAFDASRKVRKWADEDKYAVTDLPDIDCDARMHLCHGRCCTFVFPLSEQDLEEGVVKWRYDQPYRIRQGPGPTGSRYCVHSHPETHGCTVYHQRPVVCRTYSCRGDKRIWKDFDARIPADVWPPPPDDLGG
jgi:Fe-S-cluster containining protein